MQVWIGVVIRGRSYERHSSIVAVHSSARAARRSARRQILRTMENQEWDRFAVASALLAAGLLDERSREALLENNGWLHQQWLREFHVSFQLDDARPCWDRRLTNLGYILRARAAFAAALRAPWTVTVAPLRGGPPERSLTLAVPAARWEYRIIPFELDGHEN